MNKAWLVARHEYGRHVFRRSFLLTLLVVPLVIVVGVMISALGSRAPATTQTLGLVDADALLSSRAMSDAVVTYGSEAEARAALDAGKLSAYAILPPSYPEERRLELLSVEAPDRATTAALRKLLCSHLLADLPEAESKRAIAGTQVIVRTPDGGREYAGGVTGGMVLPALAGLFLLLLIFFGAGDLLDAIVEEKAGRTMEMLSTSLSPSRFLLGKVLGIAAATLTLLLAWLAFIALTLIVAGLVFGGASLLDLRPDPMAMLMLLALVIPAYLFVASGLIAAGAALSEARAGRQVTIVLLSVFLGTVSMTLPLMEDPRSPAAVLLSMLPIFSAVLLPGRNLFMEVPLWQVAVAIALQLGLAFVTLRLAGRGLRLSASRFGEGIHWREILGLERPAAIAEPAPERRAEASPSEQVPRGKPWKTMVVARHEAWTVLSKPLFLGLTLGLPLLLAVQMAMFAAATSDGSPSPASPGSEVPTTTTSRAPMSSEGVHGFVDPSGFVRKLPDEVSPDRLRSFEDEAAAAAALAAGEIAAYSLVPADYVATGRLVVIHPEANPLSRQRFAGPMPSVLRLNTVGGDAELARRVRSPMEWSPRAREPLPAADSAAAVAEDSSVDEVIGMLSMLLLYAVVVLASGLLLQSVSDEKKNRTMELLLVSLSPKQLLAGKVIGLGFVGLVQAAIWAGVFAAALMLAGEKAIIPPGLASAPSALAWGALLFIFGYAVYAGLMASAGALVPNLKEAQGVSFMMVIPALVGFVAAQFQLDAPHGAIMTFLSMFPLTAPFVMMLRLTTGGVPVWQLVLTLAIMGVTAVVIIRATARMFRAQHLLSGELFSFKRYVGVLLGRR